MTGFTAPAAPDRPTMFFVGVSTGGSFINRLFPVWAEEMGLGDVGFQGIDLPPDVAPDDTVAAVRFLAGCTQVRGALVTTHKIAVQTHARDLFASLDDNARRLGEISCITKTGAGLAGAAKDPITAGLALDLIAPESHWARHADAQALLMGCGGACVALAATLLARPPGKRPATITLTDIDATRRDMAHMHLAPLDPDGIVTAHPVTGAKDHDELISALPAGSLVVNGTGLGKDRPGSPVSDAVRFPHDGVVWEFNYRGTLTFLDQARRQETERGLTVADGWRYFLFGWAYVIADVFAIKLDADLMGRLEDAAERVRAAVTTDGRQ